MMIKYVYPCYSCLLCTVDINSPEPYMCRYDGRHEGIIEALSDECGLNKKIKFVYEKEVIDNG